METSFIETKKPPQTERKADGHKALTSRVRTESADGERGLAIDVVLEACRSQDLAKLLAIDQ